MPVQPGDLHVFVRKPVPGDTGGDHAQVGNAAGHVEHVQPGQREEGSSEQGNAPRVLPQPHSFVNEIEPLIHVQEDEPQASRHGKSDILHHAVSVTPLGCADGHDHRQTRREQEQGHNRGQRDGRPEVKRRRPALARQANITVSHQQSGEGEGIRKDEEPHAELLVPDGVRGDASAPFGNGQRFRSDFSHAQDLRYIGISKSITSSKSEQQQE